MGNENCLFIKHLNLHVRHAKAADLFNPPIFQTFIVKLPLPSCDAFPDGRYAIAFSHGSFTEEGYTGQKYIMSLNSRDQIGDLLPKNLADRFHCISLIFSVYEIFVIINPKKGKKK
jgi:hypothetical protein